MKFFIPGVLVSQPSNLGCLMTNLIAPGLTVTSTAAMVVEALKVQESTTLTDPLLN